MMVKAIRCVVHDIACSAPSGGQNAFASYPDPVGVYITIRDCGTNRTADTCCIKEMNRYGGTEDEKFIMAIQDFVTNDFSGCQEYLKKMYVGEDADKITGAEHMNFSDALSMIGEIVNERF